MEEERREGGEIVQGRWDDEMTIEERGRGGGRDGQIKRMEDKEGTFGKRWDVEGWIGTERCDVETVWSFFFLRVEETGVLGSGEKFEGLK